MFTCRLTQKKKYKTNIFKQLKQNQKKLYVKIYKNKDSVNKKGYKIKAFKMRQVGFRFSQISFFQK